jgi:hypothetical protein
MFKIMNDRCNECLYGPDKIVSNARRSQIIREINRKDSYFICHKATIAGQIVACRGDWDQRGCGQLGRIAGRLNAIEFVPEPKETGDESQLLQMA